MSDEHLACDAQAARLAEHHQPWAVWMVDVNHQRQLSQSRLRFAPWTPGELLLRKRVEDEGVPRWHRSQTWSRPPATRHEIRLTGACSHRVDATS